jgi:hypothetical protein
MTGSDTSQKQGQLYESNKYILEGDGGAIDMHLQMNGTRMDLLGNYDERAMALSAVKVATIAIISGSVSRMDANNDDEPINVSISST